MVRLDQHHRRTLGDSVCMGREEGQRRLGSTGRVLDYSQAKIRPVWLNPVETIGPPLASNAVAATKEEKVSAASLSHLASSKTHS